MQINAILWRFVQSIQKARGTTCNKRDYTRSQGVLTQLTTDCLLSCIDFARHYANGQISDEVIAFCCDRTQNYEIHVKVDTSVHL